MCASTTDAIHAVALHIVKAGQATVMRRRATVMQMHETCNFVYIIIHIHIVMPP